MRKPRILIVDDVDVHTKLLANMLKDYDISVAVNGGEALDLAHSENAPDVILLDIVMPGMDGYETCRRLQSDPATKGIPIIFVSSLQDEGDEAKGFQLGARDYVTKPFSPATIKARVKTQIELKLYRDNLERAVRERTQALEEAYNQQKELAQSYGRFVSKEFLDVLGKESITSVRLGDQIQKNLTVFFADIRDFTRLSESMTPQQTFDFLNSYLSRIAPLIMRHSGFIDKYLGDGIMALFPRSSDAVEASVHVMEEMKSYNKHRQNSGYEPVQIGIGIHTGALILGTVGFRKRMEATVISDVVNIASRIESLTKVFGAQIIISGDVLLSLGDKDRYAHRFLGRASVKGKRNTVPVFEILDGQSEAAREGKLRTADIFEKALAGYLGNQFERAALLFKAVLEVNPQDKASALYYKKCTDAINMGVLGELLNDDYKLIHDVEES